MHMHGSKPQWDDEFELGISSKDLEKERTVEKIAWRSVPHVVNVGEK
jgi:hypothetical protein